MGKVEVLRNQLQPLFARVAEGGSGASITRFLVENSNLPGRRANIELAAAFVIICEEYVTHKKNMITELLTQYLSLTEDLAPTNDPQEFLAFCATRALGIPEILSLLGIEYIEQQANDPRWRVREAVAMALQKLILSCNDQILTLFDSWVHSSDHLLLRSIAAGYAHPEVLKDKMYRDQAFEYHERILKLIVSSGGAKSQEQKILEKALQYTISVLVVADPSYGFEFLTRWVETKNENILRIITQNLKKNRLVKSHPQSVDELQHRIKNMR